MNKYCLFKGELVDAAPFKSSYHGSPHYVIRVTGAQGEIFKYVVNAASDQVGPDGNNNVYFYKDVAFDDAVTATLDTLSLGLQPTGFPKLDYWQDRSLLDLRRMRPVPYADANGNRMDVNDDISDALSIDTSKEPQSRPYDNGSGRLENRDFYPPSEAGVIVYGFGFLFQPQQDGLHETHMNQGNPRGPHWRENGAFQDGAVIIKRAAGYQALFTAFQTQYLPTDAHGFPVADAVPLPQFIRS
jgi:uncharacterized protein YukJ